MSQGPTTYRSSASQHSQHSRSISQFLQDETTDEELIQLVAEAKHQVRLLNIENEILEKAIMRLDPTLMQGVSQALELAAKLQSNSSLNIGSFAKSQTSKFGFFDQSNPSRIIVSPSRISTRRVESSAKLGGTAFGTGPRVNIIEKAELVSTEMEIVIANLDKTKRNAARKHGLLRAQLEEVGLRMTEMENAEKMFHNDVIVEGWDKIAQRIPAEIWIRFMTEWVKICDSQIGKLRLRTSTLNTQHSKLKGQIKVKAELSESLRAVDFEKLKIENSECMKLIEKKLQQLGELKKMTGDANLNLTIHKKAMMAQNSYLTNVLKSIKMKEQQTVQLDKERDVIAAQADSLAEKLDEVRKVRMAYEVPDIMDYVHVKANLADLKHSIKMLENRLHIQQIALASLNRKLNAILVKEMEEK
ncbi:cilia- and flagella-associated protein 263 [Anticarsia gemmatalis]|uniref:cilia- and flagella-associated protein 263 n=1 Tax=Anticarsia gemmatalis TaxID=129554 RepID=UPI003F76A370